MQQNEIEETIQQLVEQEVKILREILNNLSREQQALLSKNVEQVNQLIEERVKFLELYEGADAQLLASTQELADLEHKAIPPSHEGALEAILEIVSEDNIELRSRIDQLRAITAEVHKRYSRAHFLQPKTEKARKPKKMRVAVLDHPEPKLH